jgi:hypothetical protein
MEADVRVFFTGLIAAVLLAPAQAQNDKKATPKPDTCFYTVEGQSGVINVPVGTTVCRRAPSPYQEEYGLLRCDPPLDEIDLVKRGDPRCDRYEDRP